MLKNASPVFVACLVVVLLLSLLFLILDISTRRGRRGQSQYTKKPEYAEKNRYAAGMSGKHEGDRLMYNEKELYVDAPAPIGGDTLETGVGAVDFADSEAVTVADEASDDAGTVEETVETAEAASETADAKVSGSAFETGEPRADMYAEIIRLFTELEDAANRHIT